MNLRGVDLNLLVILDALLEEAHVSRAAHRLNLSQPAVSSALQRCRALFNDPLLERDGSGMRRTARAEALRGPLRHVLGDVGGLIDPPEIPLKEIVRTIHIVSADDPMLIIAPHLVARLGRTAPGVSLVIQPWRGAAAALQSLATGHADLAISVFPPDEGLNVVTLFEETYVVAMRSDHPAAIAFDLDAWLAWPHVIVSGRGEGHTPIDDALHRMGRARRIGAVVPSFQLVPPILATSDCIALLPRHAFKGAHEASLTHRSPPFEVPGFSLELAWHTRRATDRIVRHVADEIRNIAFEETNAHAASG
ncbi:LysR family transcriptional regulator [Salinarimonas ramus]|uniref:LysR family transcriptional regulator n=1 Tax=Salinarimonas ramus TaxID=690164 RepID=A0A917QJ24_9HYPH|nr:LysR family transcriptional regulator [Salinarimonas ramus]GGK52820.1 LysR family transcriptional regulator [Salinarimonas ramus]